MTAVLAVLVLTLAFAAFRGRYPAKVDFTPEEVKAARRELLPFHFGMTSGTFLLIVGLALTGARLVEAGYIKEKVAAGYGIVLLLLAVNGGLAVLARLKGEAWMSYYGAFASNQYGFDYFKVWRLLSVGGVALGLYVIVKDTI